MTSGSDHENRHVQIHGTCCSLDCSGSSSCHRHGRWQGRSWNRTAAGHHFHVDSFRLVHSDSNIHQIVHLLFDCQRNWSLSTQTFSLREAYHPVPGWRSGHWFHSAFSARRVMSWFNNSTWLEVDVKHSKYSLETTPVVELPSKNEEALKDAPAITPVVEGSTTTGVANVEISGLHEICGTQPRGFFGLTVTRNYGLFAINFVVISTGKWTSDNFSFQLARNVDSVINFNLFLLQWLLQLHQRWQRLLEQRRSTFPTVPQLTSLILLVQQVDKLNHLHHFPFSKPMTVDIYLRSFF